MKTCMLCRKSKSVTEFGCDRSRKDSLNVYCRECVNMKRMVRYYEQAADQTKNRTQEDA